MITKHRPTAQAIAYATVGEVLRSGLKANADEAITNPLQLGGDKFRVRSDPRLVHQAAVFVDDAYVRQLERHIQACVENSHACLLPGG